MASALTVKSGGTLSVKSGATVTIKDAGLPPYVVDGLEQSHWLAENAVVNGNGYVTSVADASNVQALTTTATTDAQRWKYNASGWSLNGKTLPALVVLAGSQELPLSAHTWASKLGNYAGAFTTIFLWETVSAGRNSFSWTLAANGTSKDMAGFYQENSAGRRLSRRFDVPNGGTQVSFSGSIGKQITVQEYPGTSAANAAAQFRVWTNGTLITPSVVSSSGNLGKVSLAFDRFWIGSEGSYAASPANYKLAQVHIYKGTLTDEQRNSITAYLKSISGIA